MHNELNDVRKISNFKSKGRFKHHMSFLAEKIAIKTIKLEKKIKNSLYRSCQTIHWDEEIKFLKINK